MTIAALFASLGLSAVAGAAAARDCGLLCARLDQPTLAQYRGQGDAQENRGTERPALRSPARDGYYGGRLSERRAITTPAPGSRTRDPLTDEQIWSIAKSRVPGRIVNARLHGSSYSFRIISNRGSIVDVVVDRYSGRILSVRGGP
ncbi:MAG: PepSY domain-containing protein [Alphaproteobacteria bacterium]